MRDLHFPGRSVVMSTGAMVATSQPMATAVALDVLRNGGNAMDAAVAASATLAVTEPDSTGIGGDCFILYHQAATGELHGLNGSGRAPSGATLEAYRSRGYDEMPDRGLHSTTVPGAVHAWHSALERFGSKGLDELLAPAIRYARDGYVVSPVVATVWDAHAQALADYAATSRVLLPGGQPPRAGDVHHQPQLARTLELIAEQGPGVFYEGEVAQMIVAYSDANDGFFSRDDLATHQSRWVAPISVDYRGYRIFELPPNGQGITALMMLNMLAHADIASLDPLGVERVHLFAEAYRLAMAERDRFVSDPDFAPLPIEGLLSAEFAAQQWRRFDPERVLDHPVVSGYRLAKETVYLSVVDADRNACSFINSICHAWGSAVIAGETGVLLQNRAVCFNLEEGHLNCVAPRKRSLHTIIPAMVYKAGRPVLCYGVMGGHYQPMGHSYVLSNWVDFGMDLQAAVDLPRFQPSADKLGVERGITPATRAALSRLGHVIEAVDKPYGGAQCIHIDWERGVLRAASDPRKDGCALGY